MVNWKTLKNRLKNNGKYLKSVNSLAIPVRNVTYAFISLWEIHNNLQKTNMQLKQTEWTSQQMPTQEQIRSQNC